MLMHQNIRNVQLPSLLHNNFLFRCFYIKNTDHSGERYLKKPLLSFTVHSVHAVFSSWLHDEYISLGRSVHSLFCTVMEEKLISLMMAPVKILGSRSGYLDRGCGAVVSSAA